MIVAVSPIGIGGYIHIFHKIATKELFLCENLYAAVFQNQNIAQMQVFYREIQFFRTTDNSSIALILIIQYFDGGISSFIK